MFQKKGHGYNESHFLSYVAVHCKQSRDKLFALLLGAGEGKSFLALMLAEMHTRKGASVCIVVHNRVL